MGRVSGGADGIQTQSVPLADCKQLHQKTNLERKG